MEFSPERTAYPQPRAKRWGIDMKRNQALKGRGTSPFQGLEFFVHANPGLRCASPRARGTSSFQDYTPLSSTQGVEFSPERMAYPWLRGKPWGIDMKKNQALKGRSTPPFQGFGNISCMLTRGYAALHPGLGVHRPFRTIPFKIKPKVLNLVLKGRRTHSPGAKPLGIKYKKRLSPERAEYFALSGLGKYIVYA